MLMGVGVEEEEEGGIISVKIEYFIVLAKNFNQLIP